MFDHIHGVAAWFRDPGSKARETPSRACVPQKCSDLARCYVSRDGAQARGRFVLHQKIITLTNHATVTTLRGAISKVAAKAADVETRQAAIAKVFPGSPCAKPALGHQ